MKKIKNYFKKIFNFNKELDKNEEQELIRKIYNRIKETQ